jgi:hypothetical protein
VLGTKPPKYLELAQGHISLSAALARTWPQHWRMALMRARHVNSNSQTRNPMGAVRVEILTHECNPHPTRSFTGVGAGFYFNPRVTRARPEIYFILCFAQR